MCHLDKARQQKEYYKKSVKRLMNCFKHTIWIKMRRCVKFHVDLFHHINISYCVWYRQIIAFINWLLANNHISIKYYLLLTKKWYSLRHLLLIKNDSLHQENNNVQNSRFRKWSWKIAWELLCNNNLCERKVA